MPSMVRWGVGWAVLVCVAFVVTQIFASIPLAIAGAITGISLATNPYCLSLVSLVAFAAAVGVAKLVASPPLLRLWRVQPLGISQLGAVLLATIGAVVIYSEADNIFRSVLPVPEAWLMMFEGFAEAAENPVAGIVLLVLVAPVTEELLFRGIILAGLLKRYSVWGSILISAFLFMLVHLNPWQFVGAFGLGVLAGWLYARSGSVVPGLVVHMIQNGAVCLVPWLPFEVEGFTTGDILTEPMHQPLWFTFSGVVVLVVGLVWCRFRFPGGEWPWGGRDEESGSDGPPPLPPTLSSSMRGDLQA